MKKGAWSGLAVAGATFALQVRPGARRNALTAGAPIKAEVTELLAHALGVAKSRLVLVKGATSREKVFRLE